MTKPSAPLLSFVDVPPNQTIDGINIYNRDDYNGWFENEYNSTTEPWEYSKRGAEIYRHEYTVKQIQKYKTSPERLLELGSSKGLMTERMMAFCQNLYASDISLTAIKTCKQRCEAKAATISCKMEYYVTTSPGLPFSENTFDVVTVCDGLIGWWFSEEQKELALLDIHRVLKKGGIAILTDYIMSKNRLMQSDVAAFDAYVASVGQSPLSVIEVSNLYDRPWYVMESAFKKMRLKKILAPVLASNPIAKALDAFGKLFGRKMSNHLVVVMRKD